MMLRRIFDFFIFSSLFIACCAVLMVYQVYDLFQFEYSAAAYMWFIFFSTIGSYNFHWYLTPHTASENKRTLWTQHHKPFHIALIIVSLLAAVWFLWQLSDDWVWIGVSVLLTFLYSAPKLPFRIASFLKKIAVGKTIFLASVWMYVTSILPIILSRKPWEPSHLLFCVGRFFLIYSICIIFDFRDREQDRRDGIRSMITYFNEQGINTLFYGSVIVYFTCTIALYYFGFPATHIMALLIPGFVVAGLYGYSKKNFSDYLYYFILDGMMAFSALLTSFLPF
jgi:4-hydroxybenzoate polyprenyltransferase